MHDGTVLGGRNSKWYECFVITQKKDLLTALPAWAIVLIITVPTIYGTYWKSDETDLLRKQKKQSEFLVKNYMPITCIEYIGVYNDVAKQNVLHLLINSNLNF